MNQSSPINKNQTIEIIITDMAFGGRGIGRIDDFTIFIDGGIIGQTVEAKITKKKKRYAEAKMIKVIKRGELEIETPYQTISGAPWMSLPIEKQRELKQEQVESLMKRIGGIEMTVPDITPSPETFHYRNKVEYSFGPTDESYIETEESIEGANEKIAKKQWTHTGFGLGFKKRGTYWLVESLRKPSGLFDERFETQLSKIEDFCKSTDLPVYNAKTQEGFWRNLTIRKSFHQDKLLICIGTSPFEDENIKKKIHTEFSALVQSLHGERVAGIAWQESKSLGDSIRNFESRDWLFGTELITEKINDLEFQISIDSFFQTNPLSAEKLYDRVGQLLSNLPKSSENSTIMDLFCGTGTIGQILKKQDPTRNIIGVEIVPEAIKDAKENAKRNSIEGIQYFADDVGKFLFTRPEYHGKIETIIVDPPRAGIAPKTLRKVMRLEARNIIYISCNPATMARDLQTLNEWGYKLTQFECVDQFPHTAHIECIGVLEKVAFNPPERVS